MRVPKTLGFCLFLENFKLSHYCGVCDGLNKLVILTVKSVICVKYQLANGSILRAIEEELQGSVWTHSEAIKMTAICAQGWAESVNPSTGYDGLTEKWTIMVENSGF